MIKAVVFLFIFFAKIAFSQRFDEMRKYSYKIQMRASDGGSFIGTCFFLKSKGKLYLGTNYHVMVGEDVETRTVNSHFKTVQFLSVYNYADKYCGLIRIPDKVKQEPMIDLMKLPDVYFLQVNESDFKNINTIESFIKPIIQNPSSSAVFLFGYPIGKGITFFRTNELLTPYLSNDQLPVKQRTYGKIQYYYYVNGLIQHGMSGSPVFVIYKINESDIKEQYAFIGVAARFTQGNSSAFVKPSAVEAEIKKLR